MKDPIITKNILNWYDLNKRSLPWRKNVSQTKKQNYTLVSEFMLQQTQVATVIPYFNRFIKNIPTIEKLSKYDIATKNEDIIENAEKGQIPYGTCLVVESMSRLSREVPKDALELFIEPEISVDICAELLKAPSKIP